MIRPTAFLLLAALAAAGCDGDGVIEEDDPVVVGVDWRLEAITSASPRLTVPESARYTLRLEADGRAAVRSDCNSCGGAYALSGNSIGFGPLACTRAYCGDTSLDPRYPQLLEGARTFEMDGGRLVITAEGATLLFGR